MKLFLPSNPSLISKGRTGWPTLRAEIHTTANGIGGYLRGDALTNADGAEVARRIIVAPKREGFTLWDSGEEFTPCILRMPHGRILAGWTMGEGMVTNFPSLEFFTDEGDGEGLADAWRDARECARIAAEREQEYQEAHPFGEGEDEEGEE